jgi:glutamine synthetase
MKLDRNITENDGRGKYAIIKLRELEAYRSDKTFDTYTPKIAKALKVLEEAGALDWGNVGTESEFFLIRLKDEYAKAALEAYMVAAAADDAEYAHEIMDMAMRAGPSSPWRKRPD